jgi:hypothetical protein
MEREAGQAPLRGQSSRDFEKPLLTLERVIALDLTQFAGTHVSGGTPPVGYACHVLGPVDRVHPFESRLLEEPRIKSHGHEEKETNRTPNCNLLVCKRPRDHRRVRKDQMSAGSQ